MARRDSSGFVVESDSSNDECVDITGVSHDSTMHKISFDPEIE